MTDYKHILLAVDFSAHSEDIAQQAVLMAQQNQAQLSLVHVLDNIPMPQVSYGSVISLHEKADNDLLEAEKQKLLAMAKYLCIDSGHCWLIWGVPKQEIVQLAERTKVDLIVLGSHGRHGLALLLGSTATGVLHYAQCDVLAVRLQAD